jgi:hypothetical protein
MSNDEDNWLDHLLRGVQWAGIGLLIAVDIYLVGWILGKWSLW